ncbi:MAG TPA: hypothetical protein VNA20_12835 [Frankiaceae bacterium]|nr:hypothetical protein [Frankiaceae bacterium]
MPDPSLLLFAFAPPLEDGVWLDAPPRPGTVVTAPLDVAGETQATEGVLKVELFAVRGAEVRLVETFTPPLPVGVGTVPFELTFDPKGLPPGTVTIRVVATTLARGFSAEIPGLVLPAPANRPERALPGVVVVRPAARAGARPVAAAGPVARPVLDDSGRAFGRAAPVLPYDVLPDPPARVDSTIAAATPEELPPERNGWASVAAGLLLLVTCSHLHRALRPQPDPREAR